ncbi:AMP-binding protein, partial [Psychromonas antarctica]|uniref:AMP-binding protein n=1 Tax=Psychromonas antarctica TaxID=67573 RepID=UPI001EE816B2
MTIQLENNTLAALTERSTCLYKDRLSVANIGDIAITYGQVRAKIAQIHHVFDVLGIKQGDKVAICSENMPHWGVVYLAITSMGAVVVPILPDFHRNEMHHIIKHSEAIALFASKKISTKLNEDDFSSSLQYLFSLESLDILEDKTAKQSDLVSKGIEKIAQMKAKALQLTSTRDHKSVWILSILSRALIFSGITLFNTKVFLSSIVHSNSS